ncbi:5'-3' exonuclease PLD4-like isoform X2 [Acipenser ruthenus]|uniref:5'-3' exonuclease PLD4-like isoform X2 n=1 Tax=Acipenser ruthenus TaxID=7906 RepID=UPI002741F046|nr:5'-3' exonuclease PLD4-like isoform X2 [Acipenser ruthenus]
MGRVQQYTTKLKKRRGDRAQTPVRRSSRLREISVTAEEAVSAVSYPAPLGAEEWRELQPRRSIRAHRSGDPDPEPEGAGRHGTRTGTSDRVQLEARLGSPTVVLERLKLEPEEQPIDPDPAAALKTTQQVPAARTPSILQEPPPAKQPPHPPVCRVPSALKREASEAAERPSSNPQASSEPETRRPERTALERPPSRPGAALERSSSRPGAALERSSSRPGAALERSSSRPGAALEMPSSRPGAALERPSSRPGAALERSSSRPGAALERSSSRPGAALERSSSRPGAVSEGLALAPEGFAETMFRSEAPQLDSAPPERLPSAPGARQERQERAGLQTQRWLRFSALLLWLLLLGGGSWYAVHHGIPGPGTELLRELGSDWYPGLWEGLAWQSEGPCSTDCSFSLLESIPVGLLYPPDAPALPSIFSAWQSLLEQAESSVQIAAFYLTLRDSEPTASQGRQVFEQLLQLQSRGVNLSIAVNSPENSDRDSRELREAGAEVRGVDLKSLTGGIIHTKLWVVDKQHVYIGSANMDWRSLTQVKELAVSVSNCSCLARDTERIFRMYSSLGQSGASIPERWPREFTAGSSKERPLQLKLNGVAAEVYLSSAPPSLCADGRTDDLAAILSVIGDARQFVYISVMDFLPQCQYCSPRGFWPPLDSALRAASCGRGVEVRLLVSCWEHSFHPMFIFLESLSVLRQEPLNCNVQVKVFHVPSSPEQEAIPFSRVNHAKYMVTDRVAYIGTSNWSESYFTQTAGVGLVVNQTGAAGRGEQGTVQSQLQGVFERDWGSSHAVPLSTEHSQSCGLHTQS